MFQRKKDFVSFGKNEESQKKKLKNLKTRLRLQTVFMRSKTIKEIVNIIINISCQ